MSEKKTTPPPAGKSRLIQPKPPLEFRPAKAKIQTATPPPPLAKAAALLLVFLALVLTAGAAVIQPPLYSGSNSATNFSSHLWVDGVIGSDANPGTPTAPLRTLLRAKTNATAGKTIIVLPGNYTTTNTLLKGGVNWHFMNGATVFHWATNAARPQPFDDRFIGAVTSRISGQGKFYYVDNLPTNSNHGIGLITQTNSNSDIRFEAAEVASSSMKQDNALRPATFYVLGGRFDCNVRSLSDPSNGVPASFVSSNELDGNVTNYYSSQPYGAYIGNATAHLTFGDVACGGIVLSEYPANSNQMTVTFRAQNLDCGSAFNLYGLNTNHYTSFSADRVSCSNNFLTISTGGRHEGIFNTVSNGTSYAVTINGNSRLRATLRVNTLFNGGTEFFHESSTNHHFEINAGALISTANAALGEMTGGTNIFSADLVDLSGAAFGLHDYGGDTFLRFGRVDLSRGQAGGSLVRSYNVASAGSQAGKLFIDGGTWVTSTGGQFITPQYSTNAVTAGFLGHVMSNGTNHTLVTKAPVGVFTTDANVR